MELSIGGERSGVGERSVAKEASGERESFNGEELSGGGDLSGVTYLLEECSMLYRVNLLLEELQAIIMVQESMRVNRPHGFKEDSSKRATPKFTFSSI